MGKYAEAWERYRNLRLTALLLWLGGVPYIWLLGHLAPFLPTDVFKGFLFVLYFCVWFIATLRYEFFRCPRCGRAFAKTWWFNLSFLAWRCVHCGLRKFAEDDE